MTLSGCARAKNPSSSFVSVPQLNREGEVADCYRVDPCPGAMSRPLTPRSGNENGLTLVELVIAIGLGAFIFAAVGAALGTGLRSLAAQKSRTQGNELATLGIEDLQRYSFGALGVCGLAAPVPAGFTEVARPSGCGTSTDPAFGDNPCSPPTTPVGVPSARYTCNRNNLAYDVRRYVAWSDAGQTTKRMAVIVQWTDLTGNHQVVQETSVRSPDLNTALGLDPPSFSGSPTITPSPNVVLTASGRNPPLTFNAQVEGVSTSDRLFITFNAVNNGELTATTFALTGSTTATPGVTQWTGTLSVDQHQIPVGSQFILFTAIRQVDGKTTSEAVGSLTFCMSTGCPPAGDLPVITTPPEVNGSPGPTSITLTTGGGLAAALNITATTDNVDPAAGDSVTLRFGTREGSVTTAMVVDGCDTTSGECTWRGVIDPASGYTFADGAQEFDVTAERVARGTSPTSTAAAQTGAVTFTGGTP